MSIRLRRLCSVGSILALLMLASCGGSDDSKNNDQALASLAKAPMRCAFRPTQKTSSMLSRLSVVAGGLTSERADIARRRALAGLKAADVHLGQAVDIAVAGLGDSQELSDDERGSVAQIRGNLVAADQACQSASAGGRP